MLGLFSYVITHTLFRNMESYCAQAQYNKVLQWTIIVNISEDRENNPPNNSLSLLLLLLSFSHQLPEMFRTTSLESFFWFMNYLSNFTKSNNGVWRTNVCNLYSNTFNWLNKKILKPRFFESLFNPTWAGLFWKSQGW